MIVQLAVNHVLSQVTVAVVVHSETHENVKVYCQTSHIYQSYVYQSYVAIEGSSTETVNVSSAGAIFNHAEYVRHSKTPNEFSISIEGSAGYSRIGALSFITISSSEKSHVGSSYNALATSITSCLIVQSCNIYVGSELINKLNQSSQFHHKLSSPAMKVGSSCP
ncbi:MAG: hypothetical protein J6T10_03810 [Methanobrevibacter sp.]|nr:hypothetical protein [Methanobrevibacter sp.]